MATMLQTLVSCLVLYAGIQYGALGEVCMGTVYMKGSQPKFVPGVMDKFHGAAFGYFNASLFTSGWNTLELHIGKQSDVSNNDKAFAMGYLEGYLTAKQILNSTKNMRGFWTTQIDPKPLKEITNFLIKQDDWARKYVKNNTADPLARVHGYIMKQNDGIFNGVRDNVGADRYSQQDHFILVNAGDLVDLANVFKDNDIDFDSMTHEQRLRYINRHGRCSAMVKLTPGFENIFMSQVTWFTYFSMLRIFKHYNFDLNDPGMVNKKLSFSSYPGVLVSLDEYYVLGSKMVVLQTTNNIFNQKLYEKVIPESLLNWQRVRAAHHLSDNGKQWAHVLSQYNSGTYNNQYMIVDLKKVHLKKVVEDGSLTIAEQIPGLVEFSDQSRILRNGYWPSYNVPFHKNIYDISGYKDFALKYGPDFSYQLAPRAKIFRRDANKVTTMDEMLRFMRSNNYTQDPYSEGNPSNAICARDDLDIKSPSAMGCMDGKVTDMEMALQMKSFAVNGPTRAAGTLPPFTWNNPNFRDRSHAGLPLVYTFNWTLMRSFL